MEHGNIKVEMDPKTGYSYFDNSAMLWGNEAGLKREQIFVSDGISAAEGFFLGPWTSCLSRNGG